MEKPSQRAARIGAARAVFDGLHIDYPPQTAALAALEELRAATRQRRNGEACGGIMLAAPHGTGKTYLLGQAVGFADRSASEGNLPILRVEIATAGSTDSVPTSILAALGHRRPDAGKAAARWQRAVADIQSRGVEVIAFDEFNRAGRRPTMSRPIATSIREHIMDAGIAAVAFVGTEEAAIVLDQCPELLERLEGEIDLRPLDWLVEEDRQLFIQFVDDLDTALVTNGLLANSSGLSRDNIAAKLWEASDGRIRRIVRIVRSAMVLAIGRVAPAITVDDLREATDAYAVRFRFVDRNPFA